MSPNKTVQLTANALQRANVQRVSFKVENGRCFT